MAENTPNVPSGAVPPRPAEAAKVQPKKETVRINLPPKPTSAPTIKLPTLGAGASAPVGSAAPVAAPAVSVPRSQTTVSLANPPAPPPPGAAPSTKMAAPPPPAVKGAPVAPPGMSRPQPRAGSGVGLLDKVLAVVAFLAAGSALGMVLWVMLTLVKPDPGAPN